MREKHIIKIEAVPDVRLFEAPMRIRVRDTAFFWDDWYDFGQEKLVLEAVYERVNDITSNGDAVDFYSDVFTRDQLQEAMDAFYTRVG